ncbi:alpha/beta fold hydrolase [Limibacter armeniacum]|uniref:YheT family hydrolase n=1 Tax=Limibacter armeniacum TaxID=466084 RepID=UPI002FE5FE3B
MAIIQPKPFRPPLHHFNGHMQTILPSMFRKVSEVTYNRERLELEDGDFLDLDWSVKGSDKLLIISHGLEGSADRHYCLGMAKIFNQAGWDAMAWNFRSCSGEMNRLPRFYHSGETEDIRSIVKYVRSLKKYKQIGLVGFSMGGSITLNYLCEESDKLADEIIGAVAISVPVDIAGCSIELEKKGKFFYNKNFYKQLNEKVKQKAQMIPEQFSDAPLSQFDINSLRAFDTHFTAPLHGFESAESYYELASSLHKLSRIDRKALILNATNDPFLHPTCFPVEDAKQNRFIDLEAPKLGGHVGFCISGEEATYAEIRTLEYLSQLTQ